MNPSDVLEQVLKTESECGDSPGNEIAASLASVIRPLVPASEKQIADALIAWGKTGFWRGLSALEVASTLGIEAVFEIKDHVLSSIPEGQREVDVRDLLQELQAELGRNSSS